MVTEIIADYSFGDEHTTAAGAVYRPVYSGPPVYAIEHNGRHIHESLYMNPGRPIAIVAVGPDAVGQWAAYCGASEDQHEEEEATLIAVAEHGGKLRAGEAVQLVDPRIVEYLGGISTYRR